MRRSRVRGGRVEVVLVLLLLLLRLMVGGGEGGAGGGGEAMSFGLRGEFCGLDFAKRTRIGPASAICSRPQPPFRET